jgi:hypothetical protein
MPGCSIAATAQWRWALSLLCITISQATTRLPWETLFTRSRVDSRAEKLSIADAANELPDRTLFRDRLGNARARIARLSITFPAPVWASELRASNQKPWR